MATVADQMKTMSAKLFQPSTTAASSTMPTTPAVPAVPGTRGLMTPTTPQYDDSAASNVAKITASNSPLMQMAAASGTAQANRRGLANSSIAVGASQAEVLKAATPLATTDAGINAQKNITGMQADSAINQIQVQGQVTGGLQQQQQNATKALSAQEAAQLSELEKQRAAATSEQQIRDLDAQMARLKSQQAFTSSLSSQEAQQLSALETQRANATTVQQKADIQAQMDRLLQSASAASTQQQADIKAQMDRLTQSQVGTSALSSQEATQLSALERQRAAATTDQQRADIDAQMSRLKESGSQQLSQLGAASGYEQQRIVLQGQINALAAGNAASDQRSLAVLQGGIQSALQSQTDTSAMQRLSAQYAQEVTMQDRNAQADLAKIAASGDQNVRQSLVTAQAAREQLAMQLASGDREKVASSAVQIFSAEAAIRQSLLANTTMPAAERAAYEKAISSLGDPMRNFLNNLYSKPTGSGGLVA